MEAIKVNLIPNGIPQTCHASQYDEGRQIRLDLFDGFAPYAIQSGDTFTLNVRKPDNHVVTETVTGTEGNTYLVIETTEQMTAVPGKNLCEIRVENDGDNIGSLNFIMQVEKDVIANGIPSESVIEDLDALVAEAVGDDFYTKSEVNTLLSNKQNVVEPYNDTYSFERGYVSTSDGSTGYNTVRARTPLIEIVENSINNKLLFSCVAPSSTYTFKVCAFYKDGVFVKNLPSGDYNESGTEVTLDGTFNQFRVCFSLVDDTQSMTDAQVEALSITTTTNISLKTVNATVNGFDGRIEDLENLDYSQILKTTPIKYNDTYSFERGYVSTSGGVIGYNTKRARTQLLNIIENSFNNKLVFACNAPSTIYSYKVCAFYKDGVFVKNLPSADYNASGTVVTLDGTFNQFRVCFSLKNDSQDMTDAQVEALSITITTNVALSTVKADTDNNTKRIEVLEENSNLPDLWYKGKKCVALGDSITYGFAPRNYDLFGQQLDSYAKLAAQKMGMSFVNYGIAGSTVAYHADRDPMSVRYVNMDNDADVVLFMGGTNDIRNNISLGEMSDRTNTTFYGALHVLFAGLYKKYMIDQGVTIGKTKKIVICTPIKLLQSSAAEQGGTGTLVDFEAWINAVKEVANYYSFPVLDFYNLSNINPHLNETIQGTAVGYTGYYNPYITDGTHPTQEGQDIMAEVLCGFLKSIVS